MKGVRRNRKFASG